MTPKLAGGFGENRRLNGNNWKVVEVARTVVEIILCDQNVGDCGFCKLIFLILENGKHIQRW